MTVTISPPRPPAPLAPDRVDRSAATGLAIPASIAWALAAVSTLWPASAGWAFGVAVLIAAAGVVGRARAASPAHRGLALRIAATGVACGAVACGILVQAPPRLAPSLPIDRSVVMTVRVTSVQPIAGNDFAGSLAQRSLLRGTLTGASVPGTASRTARHLSMAAPVLVFVDAVPILARDPGAVVRFTGEATRADPTDDVSFTVVARDRLRVVGRPDVLQQTAARLRAVLVQRAKTLPGDGGALLPGLAIGDTSAVSRSLDADMKSASLSHLTAVSGANCAVITLAVFALAGLLRLSRRIRIAAAVVALAGFVVLVSPQPSVLRSAVMALLALACLATGRTVQGLPALAVAVIVLIVPDPWMARNVGFVLSVLATAGLLLLTRPIADRLARIIPDRLALLVAVPIAAQIACQPVLVLLQPTVPLFGIAANMLAEPAAPVATILGLLACLTLPVAPAIGGGLAVLGWVPAAWIAAVARLCAGLPSVPWLGGAAGTILAVAVLVLGAGVAARRVPRRVRLLAAALLVVAAIAVLGAGLGASIGTAVTRPANWEIAACDVGQGDGLVLNGGGGHYVMIDTGRTAAPIQRCLRQLGVSRVDLLILTHWDADHVGAARVMIGKAASAWVGPRDGTPADELRSDLVAGGVRVTQAHRGQTVDVGRLHIEALWPPDPLGAVEPGNAASVTVLVTGTLRSIFTGDLGEDAQNALLAAGPLPTVDVVKVAHHGSADQSPAFYAAVHAGVGLISVGVENDYHHPTARLLGILRGLGTRAVRTDQDGLILVSAQPGGGVQVWTEHPVTAAVWTPAR